ncbi:MAG TPA: DUF2127 domain-containing protein [Bryobacteraceae bacterium]|jgi:uncharacterized membrane protein (DUF2068 family)
MAPHTKPPPAAVDEHTSAAALRTIATLEALKGIIVLLLGLALIFVHRHVEDFTETLLFHLHIDTDHRIGHALMSAASKVSDSHLVTILAAATSYTLVRFIEAWGLWHRRVWAEWFALLSGALYLPWEIIRIVERPDWERIAVLAVNIGIVLYMLAIRLRESGAFRPCSRITAGSCVRPGGR